MIFATLGLLAALSRPSTAFPTNAVGSGWGVNIHFTDPAAGHLDQIEGIGFKWVRMDFLWADIERTKGHYDFSDYDKLVAGLKKDHLRPLFILDYSNELYEHGSPSTPAARQAFCNWVAASMKRFRSVGAVWEMWNEPNIGFWQPQPDVNAYISLAKQVGRTIRKVAPEQWYVGPGCSTFDWKFLEACFKGGLLKYWDGVSVHPYRGDEPETVGADWTHLRQLIDQYKPAGKDVKMISSEWGYTTANPAVPKSLQAAYVIRQYIANLSAGVTLSIWYDWVNDGPDPKNGEHRFGLMNQDFTPKPSGDAVTGFLYEMTGWTFVKTVNFADQNVEIAQFHKDGFPIDFIYAWSTDNTARSFTLDGHEYPVTAMPSRIDLKHLPASIAG